MDKTQLRKYRAIRKEIQQLEDRLLEVETEAQRMSRSLKHDPVSCSGPTDKLGDQVAKMVEIQDAINDKIIEAYKEAQSIETVISQLEPIERTLMRARYIEGKSWEEVCVELNYSWRQTHYIHSNSLKKMVGRKQREVCRNI